MNHQLFAQSDFAEPLAAIMEKNLSIFKANERTFAFIEALVGDRFTPIGMSAIFPFNHRGEQEYCNAGGLKDIDLRGHLSLRPANGPTQF
ncbi:hypothetical protein [Nocardia brasiliensis]|uniref:hypothetical protein n=1 Tax=Nocardia brasiliensis TaxID=37326 RepID=UPI003D8AB550